MRDVHEITIGEYYVGKETAHKIMLLGLWWQTIIHDTKAYYNSCDVCQ